MSKMNSALSTPAISPVSGVLFAISCLFLNSFLLLVTPPHWLRLWIFGEKENRLQVRSIAATCVVWSALILVGALASVVLSLEGSAIPPESNQVVVYFLRRLTEDGSSLFAVAFWVAGMAALFASADIQIYALWLVNAYNPRTGQLAKEVSAGKRPFIYSILSAAFFTLAYWAVRYFHIPFDRLILVLLPSCLCIVPSIVLALRGMQQNVFWPGSALALYIIASLGALLSATYGEVLSVAAPTLPLLVSLGALIWPNGGVAHEQTA